jgi:hypothetical protein
LNWEEVKKAIDAILKRGNDAEIRRKGDGYIVLEVKKTIKYSTFFSVGGSFVLGKTRKVQRFLYNVRPRRIGAKEKENE